MCVMKYACLVTGTVYEFYLLLCHTWCYIYFDSLASALTSEILTGVAGMDVCTCNVSRTLVPGHATILSTFDQVSTMVNVLNVAMYAYYTYNIVSVCSITQLYMVCILSDTV